MVGQKPMIGDGGGDGGGTDGNDSNAAPARPGDGGHGNRRSEVLGTDYGGNPDNRAVRGEWHDGVFVPLADADPTEADKWLQLLRVKTSFSFGASAGVGLSVNGQLNKLDEVQ